MDLEKLVAGIRAQMDEMRAHNAARMMAMARLQGDHDALVQTVEVIRQSGLLAVKQLDAGDIAGARETMANLANIGIERKVH